MKRLLPALLLAALGAAACDNGHVTLVAPDQTTTTDTFSADIEKGGSSMFSFSTKAAGDVTITLTRDVTSDGLSSVPLLVGVGTPMSDGSCNVPTGAAAVLQTGTASTKATLTTAGFGSFCLSVGDLQSLGPVSYTIDVTHM